VPTASVMTTNAKLDGELKSADWFDAARFPTITFKSRTVTPTDRARLERAARLTRAVPRRAGAM